jgi:hypothetical protein
VCVEVWDDTSLPAGILQAVGFVKKVGQRQEYLMESWLGGWAGNISSGKMLLAGNEHQSGGEIGGNYAASVALLFLDMVE